MTEPRQIAVVRSLEDLLQVFRAQVGALGINYAILDDVTKFTDTYATKMLARAEHVDRRENGKRIRQGRRNMSAQAFDSYLDALCVDLVAVENPEKVAKLKAWLAAKIEGRRRPAVLTRRRAHRMSIDDLKPILKALSAKAAEARREKIPPEKRQKIARRAARARWRQARIAMQANPEPMKQLEI